MAKRKRSLFDINSFEVVTRNNFKKMYEIATAHYNKLLVKEGISSFDALIAALLVVLEPFTELYTIWFIAQGSQTAKTATLDELLTNLSPTKITNWEAQIIVKYAVNTERFNELLPHGHAPFGTKGKEERILAVKNLAAAIGTDAQLVALKTEVDAFYTLLKDAREAQQGKFQTIEETSSQLEVLRLALAAEMYANKGLLMAMFKTDTSQINSFFDVAAMSNHKQVIFASHLEAGAQEMLVQRTFKSNDSLKVSADQNIKMYLSNSKTVLDGSFVEVFASITKTFTVDAFNVSLSENKYLIVVNQSTVAPVNYNVEVL